MMNQQPTLNKAAARYRGLLVIWGMQLVTLLVFVALTRFVEVTARPGDDALRVQIFLALGGAAFTLSFVLRYMLLKRAVVTQRPDVATTAYVLAFALCELAAILGLMNYFLSGGFLVWLFVLAAIGLLLHFPRRAHIEASMPGSTTQDFNNPMRNTQ